MTEEELKQALDDSFKARKLTFPGKTFDRFYSIAASKVYYDHEWEIRRESGSITASVGGFKFALPANYKAYDSGTVYMDTGSSNLPLTIIKSSQFDHDYGNPDHYGNGTPFKAKIEREGNRYYIYTNCQIGTASTIELMYFKKFDSSEELPNFLMPCMLIIMEAYLRGVGTRDFWSAMQIYSATILPEAIEADKTSQGDVNSFDIETARGTFNYGDGYAT